jgi:glutamate-1-semialdehyde 2,1-aminomutase
MMTLADSPIVREYLRRTPQSRQWAERARAVFPSGITHDARRLEPYPIFVARAQGSRKWDLDGNEYVDYAGGHGALLLGHNPPPIVEAIRRQAALGTHYGACHGLEVRWGEIVQQLLPSAERVRFTSSGTEATLLALRLARAFTGRPKIMRLLGHFHGWHDHAAFGVSGNFDGTPTPGVLPELAEQVVLAPPGDPRVAEELLGRGDVAAVILEPTGASWGKVPLDPAYLHALRQLTAWHGALLVFDEVITGFRVSPGGAQQQFGIRPDLTTLAKILAGGLPGGALVGRRDVLDLLAFDQTGSGRPKVPHHGTYNANPLSAAAGIAMLEIVRDTDACARANEYARRLREALNRVLREEGVPWAVYGTFSGFHFFLNPAGDAVSASDIESGRCDWRALKAPVRPSLGTKLRLGMLIHGVELFSWPGGPTSSVHGEADLVQTAEALRATLRMLRAEGEL